MRKEGQPYILQTLLDTARIFNLLWNINVETLRFGMVCVGKRNTAGNHTNFESNTNCHKDPDSNGALGSLRMKREIEVDNLTVIPEPATILLLTLGGLALRKYRR